MSLDRFSARRILTRLDDGYSPDELALTLDTINDARDAVGLPPVTDEDDATIGFDTLDFTIEDTAHVQAEVDRATTGIQRCPACGCDRIDYPSAVDGPDTLTTWQVARCKNDLCSAEWAEVYTFSGIYLREPSAMRSAPTGDYDQRAIGPTTIANLIALANEWLHTSDECAAKAGPEPDGVDEVEWDAMGAVYADLANALLKHLPANAPEQEARA
jgi:hypothetical protein